MLDLNMGTIYFSKSWYDRAKDYFLKAYSLAERYQYIALKAFALNNYGYVLYTLGEYKQAQKILENAYQLGESPWNDFAEETSSQNLVKYRLRNKVNLEENMALVAYAQEDYSLAWKHAQAGLALAIDRELKLHQANFARLIGKLLSKDSSLDKTKQAEDYFQTAIDIYGELNLSQELCQCYIAYAQSVYERGQKDLALNKISLAKKIAIQNSLMKVTLEINEIEVIASPRSGRRRSAWL